MKICSVCQRCYEDDVLSCIEKNHHSFAEDRPEGREVISGFRLDSLLETDASGKTYQATDVQLNQPCLVKIITAVSAADGEKLRQQFFYEAQVISALNHPHLVRIYQFGTLSDGEFYVVTEDVGGQTLRDCLNKVGVPSEITAIQIARQTAEGLEAIHSAGVIHRRLNPENIILTTDAEHRLLVKIQNFDFGGINQQITISEQQLGNLKYFSPEQCADETVDAQTDIYALGVVLYEMLAGQPPFDAPEADGLIEKQLKMPPPEIKIANFNIRALLVYTLMDSLRKIPRLRLKKANAFARQLRHIEQLATHSSTPPPAMSIQPPANRIIKSDLPKTPQNEASLPPNLEDSIQVSPLVPKMTEIDEVMPIIKPPIPVLQKPVIEIISAESKMSLQPGLAPPEPILIEETEINEVSAVSVPHRIQWEQTEDIPSEREALEVLREEFGESHFTYENDSFDEDYETVETSFVMDDEIETEQPGLIQTEPATIFASYTDAQSPRFSQKSLIVAGLATLIILGGLTSILINGETQSADSSEQTAVQSSPPEKLLPKTVNSETVSKDDFIPAEKLGLKDEFEIENDSDRTESVVPEVKKRPISSPPVSKREDRNQISEKSPENKKKPDKSNSEAGSADSETKKPITFSDKIIVIGKQSSPTTENKVLTRPRVVKLPDSKSERLPF